MKLLICKLRRDPRQTEIKLSKIAAVQKRSFFLYCSFFHKNNSGDTGLAAAKKVILRKNYNLKIFLQCLEYGFSS